MLVWVPPSTDIGQRCHCHHFPNLCVPTTWWRYGQMPFHAFPSSKHYHQNATPPSGFCADQGCPSRDPSTAFQATNLWEGLEKRRSWSSPGEHVRPRILSGTSTILVHFMEKQGARQSVLPASGYLRELIQERGTQAKGVPGGVVGTLFGQRERS